MLPKCTALPSPESLFQFVHTTLCEQARLELGQHPLKTTWLRRGSSRCGLHFHIVGPRQMLCQAIWPEAEHRVVFYDSAGRRFGEVKLLESPELLKVELN